MTLNKLLILNSLAYENRFCSEFKNIILLNINNNLEHQVKIYNNNKWQTLYLLHLDSKQQYLLYSYKVPKGIINFFSVQQTTCYINILKTTNYFIKPSKSEFLNTGVTLSIQGWNNNIWYDGAILQYTNNQLCNYIAPGNIASLELTEQKSNNIAIQKDLSISNSYQLVLVLVNMLRHTIIASKLSVDSFTTNNALILVFIKKAFPNRVFSLFCDINSTEIPKNWKKLSKNLGIPIRKKTNALKLQESQNIDILANHIPKEQTNKLIEYLNISSVVIPYF